MCHRSLVVTVASAIELATFAGGLAAGFIC